MVSLHPDHLLSTLGLAYQASEGCVLMVAAYSWEAAGWVNSAPFWCWLWRHSTTSLLPPGEVVAVLQAHAAADSMLVS